MNPNEPAFPAEWFDQDKDNGQSHMQFAMGMTKREHFACEAMKTIRMDEVSFGSVGNPSEFPFKWHAEKCVAFADAVLAELSQTEPKQ